MKAKGSQFEQGQLFDPVSAQEQKPGDMHPDRWIERDDIMWHGMSAEGRTRIDGRLDGFDDTRASHRLTHFGTQQAAAGAGKTNEGRLLYARRMHGEVPGERTGRDNLLSDAAANAAHAVHAVDNDTRIPESVRDSLEPYYDDVVNYENAEGGKAVAAGGAGVAPGIDRAARDLHAGKPIFYINEVEDAGSVSAISSREGYSSMQNDIVLSNRPAWQKDWAASAAANRREPNAFAPPRFDTRNEQLQLLPEKNDIRRFWS